MSDAPANLVLEQLRLIREEMSAFRREQNDMRTVVLSAIDRVRRLERRLEEVRDDLELTIKAEIMGRMGHFETEMEKRLDSLREQIGPSPH
jgi:hypothetical protein